MSQRVLVLAALLALPALAASQDSAAPPEPARPARPAIYDEQADGHAQIEAALARATLENRRVLIQWGANWCGWCHLLHDLFKQDKAIAQTLEYEYDLVLLDIGRRDKHMDLATSYGVDLTKEGVPYLTVLAADGKVLANQETGTLELEGQQAHDPARVLEFLKSHQAAYLKADTIYQDALAQAGKDGRAVFLHFGAPWCPYCHKLDDWMRAPRTAELLGTAFVDCKIDVDRTLGGKDLLVKMRGAQEGGIPWFAFVAADGRVLATSDAPKDNVGFPIAPDEIAYFGEMLRKVPGKLAAPAIDELLASLAPAPAAPATPPAVGSR